MRSDQSHRRCAFHQVQSLSWLDKPPNCRSNGLLTLDISPYFDPAGKQSFKACGRRHPSLIIHVRSTLRFTIKSKRKQPAAGGRRPKHSHAFQDKRAPAYQASTLARAIPESTQCPAKPTMNGDLSLSGKITYLPCSSRYTDPPI